MGPQPYFQMKNQFLKYSVVSRECLLFSPVLIAGFEAQVRGPSSRLRGFTSSPRSDARAALNRD
jgi:hypothetical protein